MSDDMFHYSYYSSPVGRLLLECDDVALTGLWIESQKYYAAGTAPDMPINDAHPIFKATRKWLDEYFSGTQPKSPKPPLAPRGTDFQKRVWHILGGIPYGRTITYGEIAKRMASAPRAVGGAIGHNPISIIYTMSSGCWLKQRINRICGWNKYKTTAVATGRKTDVIACTKYFFDKYIDKFIF